LKKNVGLIKNVGPDILKEVKNVGFYSAMFLRLRTSDRALADVPNVKNVSQKHADILN
jgi:hypothetical protein